jgi:CRP-like cAMP-binding protein
LCFSTSRFYSLSMEKLVQFLTTYRSISDAEAEIIMSHFELKYFKEAAYLFTGGNVCNSLYFVVNGILRICAINDKGLDITHYFIKEHQFCTMLDSFNNGNIAQDSIQASSSVEVLEISRKNLRKLCLNLPFMADLIDQINQQRLLEKIRLKNIYSGEDSTNRYKLFLREQPDIVHRVPLNHVASYLNVTPQSLSRIRRNVK